MNEIDGQKSKTEGIRGVEGHESFRLNPYGSENAERPSEGMGHQFLAPDRKSSTEGISVKNAIGGILHQLIEDARKQLVKSRECIIWYQAEAEEYEEKLKNLIQLMELQEQQENTIIENEDDPL